MPLLVLLIFNRQALAEVAKTYTLSLAYFQPALRPLTSPPALSLAYFQPVLEAGFIPDDPLSLAYFQLQPMEKNGSGDSS